jgi:hypothetical protein
MPTLSRIFLLAMAIAFVAVVFLLGTSFTYGAEAVGRTHGAELFWLLLAIIFASPLWVPAVFATSSRPVSRVVCLLSACALLLPLWYAGAVTFYQAQLYPHPLFSVSIFATATALSAGCVVAIVILILSSLHRIARKSA